MESKVSHMNRDEEIDSLLQILQERSSPQSGMYAKHLLSSLIPSQRMKSSQWSEWYHVLCTRMKSEDALRVMVFAMMKAPVRRCEELEKLMKYANLQNEPCLNDFKHLKKFRDLALHKLMGDLADEGISVKVVNFIARHKVQYNPNKYQPDEATDVSFDGCLLLLKDAVQKKFFTLDNLSDLKDIFAKFDESQAQEVIDAFEEELAQTTTTDAHPPVTTPNPGHPHTVAATPPAQFPSSAHPMQPPPYNPPFGAPAPVYPPNQQSQALYPYWQLQQLAGQHGAASMPQTAPHDQQFSSPPPYNSHAPNQPQNPHRNLGTHQQQPQQMDASRLEPAQPSAPTLEPPPPTAPISSSQSPHSSQSTHAAHQQGNEYSSLRDRAASDSVMQRGQRETSGQPLSSVSSSGFSSLDGSISGQGIRSRGSSPTSRFPKQESGDTNGSSELVSSSERLCPGSQTPRDQTPRDQLHRQDHVEKRPQLEKQS